MSLLFATVPRVLGFLVILGIGWLVASLVEKVLVAVLRAVRFDGFADRAGLADRRSNPNGRRAMG